MLRPTKHSHPDQTVLGVATLILKEVKKKRVGRYSDLLLHTKKRTIGAEVLFLPAVNLLFLLGLVEYRPKTDSIEYVGNNEAV